MVLEAPHRSRTRMVGLKENTFLGLLAGEAKVWR